MTKILHKEYWDCTYTNKQGGISVFREYYLLSKKRSHSLDETARYIILFLENRARNTPVNFHVHYVSNYECPVVVKCTAHLQINIFKNVTTITMYPTPTSYIYQESNTQ